MKKKIFIASLSSLLCLSTVPTYTLAAQEPTITPEASVFEVPSEEIEPNKSSMVDYIAQEVKKSANKSASEEKRDEAITYIVDHFPDFYENNTVMENTMYYGYYLEYAYSKNGPENLYANLGMDTYQAVKYVYRNAEKPEDDSTLANLDQIKESLLDLGYDVDNTTEKYDTTK